MTQSNKCKEDYDVIVIDGNHLSHRLRHTMNLSTDDVQTGVLYGFITNLVHLWNKFETTSIIVCWDSGTPEFRTELYPDYKKRTGEREEDPTWPDMIRQMEQLQELLPYMGVLSLKNEEKSEADDLIYTVTTTLDANIIIVSGDTDMWQLVSDNVHVYIPKRSEIICPNNFEKFTDSLSKDGWNMYRAMVGDSSDKIKGIPGIGDKTARKLISDFQTDEELFDAASYHDERISKSVINKLVKYEETFFDLMEIMVLGAEHYDLGMSYWNELQKIVVNQFYNYQIPSWRWVRNFCEDYKFYSLIGNEHLESLVVSLDNPIMFKNWEEIV